MTDSADRFTHALSVDIGGTFTDFSLLELSTGRVLVNKVLTDPENPHVALIAGAAELLDDARVDFDCLRMVVHSTTLATNSIIERKGAKTALLTTEGFRDILQMGREQIYDIYDLKAQYPPPLVPRYLRRGVAERVDRDGNVVAPLDVDAAMETMGELREQNVEGVAVSLLHAYKNPEHEQRLKAAIEARFPDVALSLSSEVAPVVNEYERTSTTVADCYVKPAVSRYLASLNGSLAEEGYSGQLLVMHSAGGVIGSDAAAERPVRMLESGPAAGALAARFYGELLGQPDLVSLDMGGTTAKTCVIEGGRPTLSSRIEVARVHRFKAGSGLPIVIPVLELIEIGSGGGSIAWTDSLGLLKVGPQSSGAIPGPACYGQGGDEPTVTDANLVLGYLNPDYFLGGRMRLDADAASRTVARLGDALGLSEEEAAWGIYSVVTENMASSARLHVIGRNKDPRNYSVVAFGGAGPAHACEVARKMGARRVISPLAAGVTSALGCLTAPLSFEEVRSLPSSLEGADWDEVNGVYREMERQAVRLLAQAGTPEDGVTLGRSADMRLSGQIHEINVPIPAGELGAGQLERIQADFHDIYEELYSRRNLNIPIEVQNWRLLATGPEPVVRLSRQDVDEGADAGAALKGTRRAYFQGAGFIECPVFDRYRLAPGARLTGPAIVEEQESTAVLGTQDRAEVDEWFNLVFEVGGAAQA